LFKASSPFFWALVSPLAIFSAAQAEQPPVWSVAAGRGLVGSVPRLVRLVGAVVSS
jgi:hypothetical protein